MPSANIDSEVLADAKELWQYHCVERWSDHVNVILALGSHDLRVAEHAAQLILQGVAPLMVVSGGAGKVTSGVWNEPEADAYARVAEGLGVNPEQILKESASTNTTDNVVNSREMLASLDQEVSQGMLVCKPYMARRALAVATKQWPEVDWFVDCPHISFEDYPTDETPIVRMINLMVGDLQRIDLYARKGFQSPQEIPESTWNAYRRLVKAGFDQFVISE